MNLFARNGSRTVRTRQVFGTVDTSPVQLSISQASHGGRRKLLKTLGLTSCFVWLLLSAASGATPPELGSVTLAWDPPIGGSAVAGYKVYYGTASQNYSKSISPGTATKATFTGLYAGTNYYFVATSLDALGNESIFSNEISYKVPSTNAPPAVLARLAITVTAKKQVRLSGTGKPLHTFEVQSSQNLTTWSPIGTLVTDAGGLFQFTDPVLATGRSRSYRLRDPLP